MAMALASASSPPMEAGGHHSHNVGEGEVDDDEPMVTILPQEVIDALAELDLELSEGKITFINKKFNSQLNTLRSKGCYRKHVKKLYQKIQHLICLFINF